MAAFLSYGVSECEAMNARVVIINELLDDVENKEEDRQADELEHEPRGVTEEAQTCMSQISIGARDGEAARKEALFGSDLFRSLILDSAVTAIH